MLTFQQAANRVSNEGGEYKEVFIDPLTIMLICSILSTIFQALRLWCEWKRGQEANGEQIQETCRRPPLRIKRRVANIVRAELGNERYAQHGRELVAAIFRAGVAASPAELEHLAESAYTNRWGQTEQEV